jgi:hypothetical protein
MPNFRTGNWTAEQLRDAKKDLNEAFAPIAEAKSLAKVSTAAMREIEDNKYEIAELVVTVINEQIAQANPLPLIVEEVTGDWRNNYVWSEIQKKLRVDLRSPGSKPLSQFPFSWSEYGMDVQMREVAVELPLELIATGKVTPAMVAETIAQGVLREKISRITEAVSDAITAVPDRTGQSGYVLRYSGFTQPNLDKAIDGLADESDSATVFGRYITLQPTLRAFTGWSDEQNGEIMARGVIGQYHGANILALRDQYGKVWGGSHFLADDKVWVVGGQKGAIHMTQDVSFLNWAEVSTKYASFGTGFRYQDGTLVFDPYRYRILDV